MKTLTKIGHFLGSTVFLLTWLPLLPFILTDAFSNMLPDWYWIEWLLDKYMDFVLWVGKVTGTIDRWEKSNDRV